MYKVVGDVLSSEKIQQLRQIMGLTQTELGRVMGYDLRNWQRKETSAGDVSQYNASNLTIGESNFLLLLADAHPDYKLKNFSVKDNLTNVWAAVPESGQVVAQLRKDLGLKQQEIAELFGYSLNGWKSKQKPSNSASLKVGEYNFMMLLAGTHPAMRIESKE